MRRTKKNLPLNQMLFLNSGQTVYIDYAERTAVVYPSLKFLEIGKPRSPLIRRWK